MKNIVLLIISDIHLEGRTPEMIEVFAKDIANKINEIKKTNSTPILICAGDIGEGTSGFIWSAQFDCEVIYVCGNHEFWGHDYFKLIDELTALDSKDEFKHMHFLHNKAKTIHGLYFIGSTLWTNLGKNWNWFQENYSIKYFNLMSDFRKIKAEQFYLDSLNVLKLEKFLLKNGVMKEQIDFCIKNKLFNPLIQMEENKIAADFLQHSIENSETSEQNNKIIVTHHLPTSVFWKSSFDFENERLTSRWLNNKEVYEKYLKRSILPKEDILMLSFYANDLKNIFNKVTSPRIYIHGHFHKKLNGFIGKTHIFSCPTGYLKQSEKISIGEVSMQKNELYMLNFLEGEIEKYHFNNEIVANIINFINYINSSKKLIESKQTDISQITPAFNLFLKEYNENIGKLESVLLDWLEVMLGVSDPKFYNLKHKNDFFNLVKLINLEKIKLNNNQLLTMPNRLNFSINHNSFIEKETLTTLGYNKSNDNMNYKFWVMELQKNSILIANLKNFLLKLIEAKRNKYI